MFLVLLLFDMINIYDLKLERPVYREKDDAEMKISGT